MSDEAKPGKPAPAIRVSSVTWRAQVQARARELADELLRARASAPSGTPSTAPDYGIAERNIELAARLARSEPRVLGLTWLRRWASGSDTETAWTALHDAEAAMMMILPSETLRARLPDLRAGLSTALAGDGRLEHYLKVLTDIEQANRGPLTREDREQIRVIKSVIDATSDAAHSNIRNYRNWLLIVSLVVTAGLLVVAIAHSADPGFLHVREAGGGAADLAQLEAAGAVGGLLMALFALIRLTVFSGPVALPLWQALVRIPAGAAAGIAGAILLQGQILSSIAVQGRAGLLGYSVLFGAVPELLLRFLDKRVNEATAAARPKNDPLKSVPSQDSHDGED
jgi:hypothetical protein